MVGAGRAGRESTNPPRGAIATTGSPLEAPNVDALAGLYEREREQGCLFRHAVSVVGAPEAAEDVVHEAFAATARRIAQGAQIANLQAYLHATVRNFALERMRQRPTATLDEVENDLELPHVQSAADLAHARQRYQALYRAIDQLPTVQRSAFLLAEVRGLNYREVAASLNRSEAAIRQLLSRARSKLRDAIGPDLPQLALPLLGLERGYLRSHGSRASLREYLSTKLAGLHGSLSSLMTRSAEFLTHVAQPAAALVAAAVIVGTTNPSVPHQSMPPGDSSAVDLTASRSQAPSTTASEGTGSTLPPAAPAQADDQGAGAPESGRDRPAAERGGHGSHAAANDTKSAHVGTGADSGGQAGDPPTPAVSGGSDPPNGVVSKGLDGPADGPSGQPSVNAGGSKVAFMSLASNLVLGDMNGTSDVFLSNTADRSTVLISAGLGDRQPANGPSSAPAIASATPLVAFSSAASNLVQGDTNGAQDIFVHNYQTRTTERMSLSTTGDQADGASDQPAISADGRYVAFASAATNLVPGDTNGAADIFAYDRRDGTTERISVRGPTVQANGASGEPSVSADGRYVSFTSSATNLVPDDTNGVADIFVYDRLRETTQLVSQAPGQRLANGASTQPAISADGRYVSFTSAASNLAPGDSDGRLDIYEVDRLQRTTMHVSAELGRGGPGSGDGASPVDEASADCSKPSMDASGRLVSFQCVTTSDSPAGSEATKGGDFVHDRSTNDTRLAISLSLAERLHATTLAPAIDATGTELAGVVSAEVTPDPNSARQFSDRAVFVLGL